MRYDLSAVGRVKMNMRMGLDAPDTMRVLRKEDMSGHLFSQGAWRNCATGAAKSTTSTNLGQSPRAFGG